MSQVILIEENDQLRDVLEINLKNKFGIEVISRSSGEEAIEILNILPSIKLIISHSRTGGESTGPLLSNFLIEKNSHIGLIILGQDNVDIEYPHQVVFNPKELKTFLGVVQSELGLTQLSQNENELEYVSVPINYFYPLNTICCDVFIRIKKGGGKFQYIKRFNQGEPFDSSDLVNYTTQGLKEFYILKEYQNNFANLVSDQLLSHLERTDLDLDSTIKAMAQGFDIASYEIKELGITGASAELSESIMKSMKETVDQKGGTGDLLNKVMAYPSSYLYQCSHLTILAGIQIAKSMGIYDEVWGKRFSQAAFFHDLTLIDFPDLSELATFDELQALKLEGELEDLVFFHAQKAADICRSFPDFELGSDTIILEHHGSKDGKGLPLSTNEIGVDISENSKIFLVAEAFGREVLRFKKRGGAPRPLIPIIRELYPHKSMKDVIDYFNKSMKK